MTSCGHPVAAWAAAAQAAGVPATAKGTAVVQEEEAEPEELQQEDLTGVAFPCAFVSSAWLP